MWRQGRKTETTLLRLFGKKLALIWLPAAAHIERRVMRLAEQHAEIGCALMAQRLDRGIERDAGIAVAAAVGPRRHRADAAGAHFSPIPGHLAPIDADMTDQALFFRLHQHPQI